MHPALHAPLAAELFSAFQGVTSVAPLSGRHSELGVDDAYQIQRLFLESRLTASAQAGQPDRIIGRKIGLTNAAVQRQLGVSEPDFGALFASMEVADGGTTRRDAMIAPKIEGELAFVLERDLSGPGVTARDVVAATAWVTAALEIVDSRIADWRIGIVDTVADNASAGLFVLGTGQVALRDVDLRLAGVSMRCNGQVVSTGATAASLGNPVAAVAWLANRLGREGQTLRAGDVILSGALCPLVAVSAGQRYRVDIGGVGAASVRFS
jgi:2-oxopent-4-enoate/cis-2-oxohex-4-enoate hydratase